MGQFLEHLRLVDLLNPRHSCISLQGHDLEPVPTSINQIIFVALNSALLTCESTLHQRLLLPCHV